MSGLTLTPQARRVFAAARGTSEALERLELFQPFGNRLWTEVANAIESHRRISQYSGTAKNLSLHVDVG